MGNVIPVFYRLSPGMLLRRVQRPNHYRLIMVCPPFVFHRLQNTTGVQRSLIAAQNCATWL
jgi:hypothetical protein